MSELKYAKANINRTFIKAPIETVWPLWWQQTKRCRFSSVRFVKPKVG